VGASAACFQPGSNVHAVAVDVITIDDNDGKDSFKKSI
jgi:hypothetical protein